MRLTWTAPSDDVWAECIAETFPTGTLVAGFEDSEGNGWTFIAEPTSATLVFGTGNGDAAEFRASAASVTEACRILEIAADRASTLGDNIRDDEFSDFGFTSI